MPSRAYTSFLQEVVPVQLGDTLGVNALSSLYLISTPQQS